MSREQRPFVLWQQAGNDFDKAVALIPADWSADRKRLWQARLAAIRDNEHIRRIEQPVYKRRWDEQWKVGNRWTCGPVAYAAELVDAFRWWLAEKAEWYLEKKAGGGPLDLATWTGKLWSDARVQAAWPVIAEAINQVEQHKAALREADRRDARPTPNNADGFARFFRELVKDETVPDGIPWAVPWEQLEKKMKVPAKVKAIRGKLNVPRERFRLTATGDFIWAGMK